MLQLLCSVSEHFHLPVLPISEEALQLCGERGTGQLSDVRENTQLEAKVGSLGLARCPRMA